MDFQAKLSYLKENLNEQEKKFVCLKSIENFLLYYNELNEDRIKVEDLLIRYFKAIDELIYSETGYYLINFETCKVLVVNYIMPLGRYYAKELDFKILPKIDAAFFWGLQIDLVCYFLGVSIQTHYIPVATILLLIQCFYRKIFYEKKHKVYAGRY